MNIVILYKLIWLFIFVLKNVEGILVGINYEALHLSPVIEDIQFLCVLTTSGLINKPGQAIVAISPS